MSSRLKSLNVKKNIAKKPKRGRKPCPSYKLIEGTNYAVDAFNFLPIDYEHEMPPLFFLSHFHSDHYVGLLKSFSKAKIHCTEITAELLKQKFSLANPSLVQPLPMNKRITLHKDIFVTLLDANHCPGSAMFLFELNNKFILHTGDFRFDTQTMKENPFLKQISKKNFLDILYLDTTYCDPKYIFPTQQKCIDYITKTICSELQKSKNSMLFVIGTYSLGKEKILLDVAEKTKKKICVDSKRMAILEKFVENCQDIFTTDKNASCICVTQLFRMNFSSLKFMRGKFDKVVAFKPTGWSGDFGCKQSGRIALHSVPYSEHSSFSELEDCVNFLKPKKIISTVIESCSSVRAEKLLLKSV